MYRAILPPPPAQHPDKAVSHGKASRDRELCLCGGSIFFCSSHCIAWAREKSFRSLPSLWRATKLVDGRATLQNQPHRVKNQSAAPICHQLERHPWRDRIADLSQCVLGQTRKLVLRGEALKCRVLLETQSHNGFSSRIHPAKRTRGENGGCGARKPLWPLRCWTPSSPPHGR